MTTIWSLLQSVVPFLFVLGVLIFVHELGHFLVARMHGVRVLRFSLGFDPKIVKFTRGGTEYSIGAIPLGGFVKLAGETVEDDRSGAPDEFLSKSKWVRFQVYIAGPIMNLLLAWLVLAAVMMRGADVPLYYAAPPVLGSVVADGPAARAGLASGDRVISVNGRMVTTWDEFEAAVGPLADQKTTLVVERQGVRRDVVVTPRPEPQFKLFGVLDVRPMVRPQITAVNPGSPAARAGLERGDVVLALNGESQLESTAIITRIQGAAGRPLEFKVERQGVPTMVTVTPDAGVIIGVTLSALEVRRVDPTVAQALLLSAKQNWNMTKEIGSTLRDLVTRKAPVKQLMGPVGIAQMSGSAAKLGFVFVMQLMAMISLNLGLMNLLPVPVLDGGHIAILGIESIARRDLSVRVKERMLMTGAALIVLLMVTVIYNDVTRLFR